MKEKKCTTCGVTKSLDEYYARKASKDGKRTGCRGCEKEYRERNKERIKARKAEYYQENKKAHYARVKKYREGSNREKYLLKSRERYQTKKKEIHAQRLKRRRENPSVNLRHSVGLAVYQAIKRTGNTKGGKTFDALPYTPQQLKEHIESQFQEGMTWDNHGEWHIDHIIPQAALQYDSLEHENFQKCWALDNLQPLWAADNIRKSSVFEGKRHRYKK